MDMTHRFTVPALPRLTCSYSEAAYFEGNHCAHCAARDDFLRLQRIRDEARRLIDRRSARRGILL